MDRISAFMDGETGQHEARQVILNLRQHAEHYESWNTFHLIGDVMRGDSMLREDFTARLRGRLQQEPAVLAPRFKWHAIAGPALSAAASLAAVAVILTLVLTDNPLRPQSPPAVVAKSQTARVVPPAAQPVSAQNQGRINEYLIAHQEFSTSTVLQDFAPYARTVSATYGNSGR